MKLSKRKQAEEARRASDPIAQLMERTDVDYENPDELPTAPRIVPGSARTVLRGQDEHSTWAVVAADVEPEAVSQKKESK